MLRALCLTMAVVLLLSGSAFAESGPDSNANAALKYWQAFATLPVFTDAENQKIGDCLTTPLDDSARKILTNSEYSLTMMHYATAIPRCEWGITFEDGVYARLPHAIAARVLSSLACLRARTRFEAGQNADAIDDIIAAMTLGRQATKDGTLVVGLVGYAIDHRAIVALSVYMPKLDAKTIKDLKTRVDALPPFGSPSRAVIVTEKETIDWFIRKVKETKDEKSLLSFLKFVGISEGKDREAGLAREAREFFQKCGGTAEGVLKFAEETRPFYESSAKLLDLPLDEFQKQFKAQSDKQAANPVYKVFFPALNHVRRSKAAADVRSALFHAAIAVQLDGKDSLKDYSDPVVGGPFEYVAFQGGFELRSTMKGPGDKPLSITVGSRN